MLNTLHFSRVAVTLNSNSKKSQLIYAHPQYLQTIILFNIVMQNCSCVEYYTRVVKN